MNEEHDFERKIADSTSDGWAFVVPPEHIPAARRWLLLGLWALAGAGAFALLLAAARSPGAQDWLPGIDLFRIALVVHVDLLVLVWSLAFAGFLWTVRDGERAPWGGRFWWLAAAGTLLMVLAPLTGARPILNNYIPVLHHPLFLLGLGLFAAGAAARAFLFLETGLNAAHRNPVSAGMFLAAVATVLAAFTFARTGMRLPGFADPEFRFEVLFWPAGHVLQFAYTALTLTAWLWLCAGTGLRLGVGPRWPMLILLSGIIPFLAVVLIELTTAIGSIEQRIFYTRLMRWGGLWPMVPIGLVVLIACLRGGATPPGEVPARRALYGSVLLFAVGGGLGWMIQGVNTVIPAHYHGMLGGTTLALMGLTYHLLPQLGYRPVTGRAARWQPGMYAAGQLLHVAGLAISGMHGVQRKTAGAAQALDSVEKTIAMGLAGAGGLLAVIGGLLFVLACYKAIRGQSR